MQSSTIGERVTAAVSTLVAVAILGAAVTAQQSSGPVADAVADFESDLRYQIDLTLRHDGAALKAAHEAVDQTLSAWRASPQSPDDRRLLLGWFDAAISATMPGHSGKLPPQPEFTSEAPVVIVPPQQPAVPTPTEPTPAAVALPEVAEAPVVEFQPAAVGEDGSTAAPVDAEEASGGLPLVEQPEAESSPVEHSITIAPTEGETSEPTSPSHSSLASPDETVPVEAAATPDTTTLAAPPVGATPYEAELPRSAVNVNLGELNARIEGYNHQLAGIEASMVVEEVLSGPRLTKLVDEIELLAGQYQFVKLYYDSLTAEERQRSVEPRSMSDAIAIASGLASREEASDDFLADFAAEGDAPTLSDRLRAIADATGAR